MGKRKLLIGAVAGAVLGVIAMQFDKETRMYTRSSIDKLKIETNNLMNNPTEAVQSLRAAVDKVNHTVNSSADSTYNALEQVENTINKFLNK
ncbi:YtxH domain-containing protein [Oceanobacillus sp. CAU 1775]